MRSIITEPFVQESIIKHLEKQGWAKNLKSKGLVETGCDIIVQKNNYGRYWYVECKGDPSEKVKSPSGSRSSGFNSAVGQIITRMHTNRKRNYKYGYKFGVGFPESYKKMVLRKLPFDVCDKLNLYVFFVNQDGEVEELDHNKIKKAQPK